MSREHKKIEVLKLRAKMFQKARQFFAERDILEVDTPHLTKSASVDSHIDLIKCNLGQETLYLNSSPEYAMKRLLAMGAKDIYQLGHVFREGELGDVHHPEFTLCEWYRIGFTFQEMIDETLAFIKLFLGEKEIKQLTYQEAFLQTVKLNPITCSTKELQKALGTLAIATEDRDLLLHQAFSFLVEPKFPKTRYTVITHFPKEQAALAKCTKEGFALRFEVFTGGLELANGYDELKDPIEQRERFRSNNMTRELAKKETYPLDEQFLKALEHGLPDCTGVACGMDRLLLLQEKKGTIEEVLPFSLNEL